MKFLPKREYAREQHQDMLLRFNDFENLRYVVLGVGVVRFSAPDIYKVIDG